MIDFQVFLFAHQWLGILIAVPAVAGTVIYFLFIRVKTDSRVSKLADLAYACAAKIMGVKPKGSTPPVRLRDAPWKHGGRIVYGLYSWLAIFGRVLWDRIQVVEDRTYLYPVLVHEMTHALRRRMGHPTNEKAAYAAQAVANERCGGPEVDALLEKL